MRPIIIESPMVGCYPLSCAYHRECMRQVLREGGTPYSSSQQFSGVMESKEASVRALAVQATFAMRGILMAANHDTRVEFWVDLGWSAAMNAARIGLNLSQFTNRELGPDSMAWARIIRDAAALTTDEFERAKWLSICSSIPEKFQGRERARAIVGRWGE